MALEITKEFIVYELAPIIKIYLIESWHRFIELLQAPIKYPDMIWILTPLFLTMLLMEFYFGRYKTEELGWNTAFSNSLVLIFVSIDLMRFLYNTKDFDIIKIAIIAAVIISGFLLTFLDFFHWLPEKFAYAISSKLPINFLAISAVILVYSELIVDAITIGAFFFFLIFLYLLIEFIHHIEPESLKELMKEAPSPPKD